MNHSIKVIINFICQWYAIPFELLMSTQKNLILRKARFMIVLLSGKGRDIDIATGINRSQEDIRYLRMAGSNAVKYNKMIRDEFNNIQIEILKFEIL